MTPKTKQYKIAIGIPSYNESDTIRFVINQVDQGLTRFYNAEDSLIVNLDSSSPDDTKKVFLQTPTRSKKIYLSTPPGKGLSLISFFRFCLENEISYIATVDADLKSITPEWVRELLNPIINEGFEFTLPVYARNRFEANITNHFAFPSIYATYGVEMRQPLAGEFGYHPQFCKYLLQQKRHTSTNRYGIDIFMCCHALIGGFKIKEVILGRKIHRPSFYHMEPTFRQVAESALFVTKLKPAASGEMFFKRTSLSAGIDPVEYFPHKKAIPQLLKNLARRFTAHEKEYLPLIGDTTQKVKEVIMSGQPKFSAELWAEVLSKIICYCRNPSFKDTLLPQISRLLVPIYRWHVATFWLNVESLPPSEVEAKIHDQADLIRKQLLKNINHANYHHK